MSEEAPNYYSILGPQDGPFAGQDAAEDVPVFESSSCQGEPIGVAHPVGWISEQDVSVKLFRLKLHTTSLKNHDASLNDLWICDRRTFVRFVGKVELL